MAGRGLKGLALLLLLLVMARLWSSGFELQSATAGVEWDAVTSGTIDTGTKRSGGAAGKVIMAGSAAGFSHDFAAAAANGPYFIRVCVNASAIPSTAGRATMIMIASTIGFNGNTMVFVDVDNNGTLILGDEDGDIGSSSVGAFTLNTWHRIEIKIDRTPASGSHVVEAKLNGTVFATSATRALSLGLCTLNVGGGFQNVGGGTYFFDDVAINDSTGTAQTGYPGDGKIVHMYPDSAGDNAAWSVGIGGANHWDNVNEVTPNDATDYHTQAAAGAHLEDYNCQAWSSVSTDVNPTITLVHVGLRGGANGTAGTRQASPRIKKTSGGTVSTGTAFNWAVNGWATNGITTPHNYGLTRYTDPDGAAWTTTTLDSMQIGYDDGATSTSQRRVSTVWALVEYVPAAAAGKVPTIISSFMGRF